MEYLTDLQLKTAQGITKKYQEIGIKTYFRKHHEIVKVRRG